MPGYPFLFVCCTLLFLLRLLLLSFCLLLALLLFCILLFYYHYRYYYFYYYHCIFTHLIFYVLESSRVFQFSTSYHIFVPFCNTNQKSFFISSTSQRLLKDGQNTFAAETVVFLAFLKLDLNSLTTLITELDLSEIWTGTQSLKVA